MSRVFNILQLWVVCVLLLGNAPVPYVHQHATCAMGPEDSVLESHLARWHAECPFSLQRLGWHVHFAPLSDQSSGNENWPEQSVEFGAWNCTADAPAVDPAPRVDAFVAVNPGEGVDPRIFDSSHPAGFLSTYDAPAPVLLNVVRC